MYDIVNSCRVHKTNMSISPKKLLRILNGSVLYLYPISFISKERVAFKSQNCGNYKPWYLHECPIFPLLHSQIYQEVFCILDQPLNIWSL